MLLRFIATGVLLTPFASPAFSQQPIPEFIGNYAIANGKLIDLANPGGSGAKTTVVPLGHRASAGDIINGQRAATSTQKPVLVLPSSVRFLLYSQPVLGTSVSAIAKELRLIPLVFARTVSIDTGWPNKVKRSGQENGWDSLGSSALGMAISESSLAALTLRLKPVQGQPDMVIAATAQNLPPGLFTLSGPLFDEPVLFAVEPLADGQSLKCADVTCTWEMMSEVCKPTPCGSTPQPASSTSGDTSGTTRSGLPAIQPASLSIDKAVLADNIQNGDPAGVRNRFPPDARSVVCYIEVSRERAGQVVEFAWIEPDGRERARTSSTLKAASPRGAQFLFSKLTPRTALQNGDWRVDIYADGALAKQIGFSVQ